MNGNVTGVTTCLGMYRNAAQIGVEFEWRRELVLGHPGTSITAGLSRGAGSLRGVTQERR